MAGCPLNPEHRGEADQYKRSDCSAATLAPLRALQGPYSHTQLSRTWVLLSLNLRRRQWHPTPVLLPGKSHGQRSLVGCSPWGREESDTTEQLHFHFSLSCVERNGNPLQYSCLENPRDRGAWWAAVMGSHRVGHDWSDLAAAAVKILAQQCLFINKLSCNYVSGSSRSWEHHESQKKLVWDKSQLYCRK